MRGKTLGSRGFTLIASMLMMLLLSGIAIGLLMMVNTEGKVGGADVQNNLAYHNAEGGIEQMTADLAAAFQNAQAPRASDICALSAHQPVIAGVTWKQYSVQPASGCADPMQRSYGQVQSGPSQGLYAQLIPVNMLATAAEPSGQEVSMMRTAQVALIPVFQFGVFCDGDCSFFSGPNFDFAGRVHVNGDLYPEVGGGSTLTFHDRLTVYGNVVRTRLANGFTTATQYNGTVYIPKGGGGCDAGMPNCRALAMTEGSITGAGGNPPQSPQNPGWPTLSVSTYNSEILDGNYGQPGGTGAKKLALPFVNGTTFAYEIIRRPPAGEPAGSALGQSREYNMAQIRVLLSDDPADLPGGAADANNIRLANFVNPGVDYSRGVPLTGGAATTRTYFAEGTTAAAVKDTTGAAACLTNAQLAALPLDWPAAPAAAPAGAQTLQPIPTAPLIPATPGTWNLLDGYLRVEYKDVADNWNPVTREWLELGFARGTTPPVAPGSNPIHPNAILILQQPADRNGNGAVDAAGAGCNGATPNPRPAELQNDATTGSPYFGTSAQPTSLTRTNWYPINFYDAREGEVRDTNRNDNTGTANGVMNAVELDAGNLKRWLSGAIGASGGNVDFLAQNGYVLYFSDRRGMLPNPNPPCSGAKCGDSGLEDTINAASANGVPDGLLDPIPPGKSFSPEDVNQNLADDNYGAANLGLGFYNLPANAANNINAKIIAVNPDDPYAAGNAGNRILVLASTGRKNWVSGARHVLKLVDAGYGNVPVRTDTNPPSGGFTVASENPVYIQGNYNSDATDPAWGGTPQPADDQTKHSATAIIADAVTFLSNAWQDRNSMLGVTTTTANRTANNTWYRVAIAGGKNMNFPQPIWGASQDFGTDGGVHNFLRYLENWGGQTLWYKGSLVSLYYATYDTGVFKCCTTVYSPPTRNYSFDSDFTTPSGLPPGTPLFRDVDNLSYRQLFTTRTN